MVAGSGSRAGAPEGGEADRRYRGALDGHSGDRPPASRPFFCGKSGSARQGLTPTNQAERGAPPQPPLRIRIEAMTDIEVQESYTDHDGGEFSAVNVRVVATWPAPTFVENLAIDPAGAISSASIPIISTARPRRSGPERSAGAAAGAPPNENLK